MKHRSPIAVALLPFVTFGIYALYWEVVTKEEMKKLGADIPTAWLLIVPIVNYWWLWKYCVGVEKVTGGKLQGVLAFILIFLVGPIGAAIVQDSFNNNVVSAQPGASSPVMDGTATVAPPVVPPETTLPPETPPADQPPTNPVQ